MSCIASGEPGGIDLAKSREPLGEEPGGCVPLRTMELEGAGQAVKSNPLPSAGGPNQRPVDLTNVYLVGSMLNPHINVEFPGCLNLDRNRSWKTGFIHESPKLIR